MLLQRHDVPCGPKNTFDDIVIDPHVIANKMLEVIETPWGGVMHSHLPLRFSRTDHRIRSAVKPDSSRAEILDDIGYKED